MAVSGEWSYIEGSHYNNNKKFIFVLFYWARSVDGAIPGVNCIFLNKINTLAVVIHMLCFL
jgi:hypothetical protein